ncbi:Acid phosphatase-like protein [Hapsidospora chrysogenum ATCC 11550]|uniref:Acid phosphatase-like protein n=1 Tax=Hapsidospora chrysogenum (strain ATCC 11550 / CBS 779.69 / DSM 880 / IAM 14645 / JCM 23072 / IMI 49137) TaxID=857340 RepID=A0A086SX35_HAPC1|nr:Acid phosphatase-like protein [Hapsidospora chrysogenum ATCC 11550]
MKTAAPLVLFQALAVQGLRIVQSNDDGWAESYARSLHAALTEADHDVVLSAPAENKSGTGSSDAAPEPREKPCIYDSCPADSGPTGFNETSPELNWVNSFPVTSMKHGINTAGPALWDGAAPELAVSGPNVGSNLFLALPFSGTVGAACYAVMEEGIPALAFSGASDDHAAWNEDPPESGLVYAELATQLTNKVIASGTPYLPEGIFLNVNFPKFGGDCSKADNFEFVLSRINPGIVSEPDVEWCGSDRLPTELDVINADGCYVSVSIGDASDKTTANDERQGVVLEKLKDILVCLP